MTAASLSDAHFLHDSSHVSSELPQTYGAALKGSGDYVPRSREGAEQEEVPEKRFTPETRLH
jgi:hypothetical protein